MDINTAIPLTDEVEVSIPQIIVPVEPTAKEPEELPPWLNRMVKRQDQLNAKYERAHSLFAQAYNDFLSAIDEINFENDTRFTFEQAVREYKGYFAADAPREDDEDED